MDGDNSILRGWYDALLGAHDECKPVDSLASTIGQLSVDQGYEVQAMVVEQRLQKGEKIIGWKVGSTSQAVMEQLKIGEPIFGCMTTGSHYSCLREVRASDFCKLAVEGEIAFVMGKPLKGPGVTNSDVMMATAGIMGAVELVDSRIKDWSVNISEAVADNSLHAGVIMGPCIRALSDLDLRHEGVVMSKNGRLLASACGAEALGNPIDIVAWLANKLAEYERELKQGDIVLTGSLTKFFFVEPGDVMSVTYSNLGSIQFPVAD